MTTKAEAEWMSAIVQLGCIACRVDDLGFSPAVVHHLLRGSRRIGHLSTIPLCPGHHSSGLYNKQIISRHPWKRAFEQRYGTEAELLAMVAKALSK